VIVADVLIHEALQMPFIEHDHMVEQIAAAVSDPAFSDAILPRTAEAGSFRLNAKTFDGIDNFFIELCAAIEDQVLRCRVVRERLTQLLTTQALVGCLVTLQ
jgi:hypothetical protein